MSHAKGLIRHPQNQSLFEATEESILATYLGTTLHIHAEGLRGTGKTTIMRSAKRILPSISRIKGCMYNCDPTQPHCPHHRGMSREELDALGVETITMPFVEISQSAKIGTVVGSIDLARLTGNEPSACLLPGLIAQAHRGILFVDEINRLADTAPELADVLLDVMGTKPGRIQIEETGLPKVELPVQVSVWAASNPDEEPGALAGIRRQLSDRFDLVIPVYRPTDIACVSDILRQAMEGCDATPWEPPAYPGAAMIYASISLDRAFYELLATMYVDFNVESLRAMEALGLASRLDAARRGQQAVQLSDLRRNLPLALGHRVDATVLADMLRFLQERERTLLQENKAMVESTPVTHPEPSSGNEDALRPVSGPPVESREYREVTMPFSSMLNHLMQRLVGQKHPDYMPQPVSYAPSTRSDEGQRAGSGLTGGHQTGVGPGVCSDNTELPPVAPMEEAKPMELLRYSELVKGPEELKP
ncbi:MAG: ATP-binding protein [Bacillota bacterium]